MPPHRPRALAALLALLVGAACPPKATTPPDAGAEVTEPTAPGEAIEPGAEAPPPSFADDEAPPPAIRPPPQPVSERDAVAAAIAGGNHEGAIDFLDTWLTGHPDDLEAALLHAHASAAIGQTDRAEAVLSGAAAGKGVKDPRAKATLLRAQARLRGLRGDRVKAEALLREALKAAPGDLPTQGDLLALLVARGRGREAEAKALMEGLYDAYDAGKATHAEELLAIARAALARGTSGAFHDANMVLGEAESAPCRGPEPEVAIRDRVLLVRGSIFHEKYAAQDAGATYSLILDRDPWHADALAGLALVGLDNFKLAEADRLAQRALQTNPGHPLAYAALARISVIEGRRREARERAAKIAEVDPDHPEALAVLAAAAIVEGDRKASADADARAIRASGDGARYAVTLAELLVSMHLYPEAGEVLKAASARAPDDAYVSSALGLNQLRLGDEAAGREALRRAWKRDRFNERTRNVLDLYDQKIDKHYSEVKAARLDLRLPTIDDSFVADDLVAIYARARKALDGRYGIDPGKLRLEVFADPDDFSIRTVGVPSLGAVGVCFGPLITLVGPYQGTHNIHQVIWHELAHVYAIRLSQGRVPRWFTEGLSEWESELADPSWARESAELLAAARRQGKLRRLGDLELAFLRAESALGMEVAYASAAYALRYLGETYGHDKIKAILKGYASGASTEELFERHLGRPFAEVEAGFDAYLSKSIDAAVSGWSPSDDPKAPDPRDRLYRQALDEVRGGDLDAASRTLQKLIQSGGDGYRIRMALADILRQGPSWEAAEAHLQRARTFNREAIEPLIRTSELARRRGDLAAEKQALTDALAIDAMSFDPAARLLMLATVTHDAKALALARDRSTAIAPLHPITLAANAIAASERGDKAKARTLQERAAKSTPERGPSDTLVVMALAAAAVGDREGARALAKRASGDAKLPKAAQDAMAGLAK
ncbi:MAG: hypothetical protein H6710_24150 [Myxococcales bacterium]|nr:hypothetical protein [Myxococcales bacterium]MCB9706389.1 hypothetical protein [Myxococcales bacterium]